MKITIFNGSAQGERGNTQIMVDAFLEGAQAAGARVESVALASQQIQPCKPVKPAGSKRRGAASSTMI